jgi:hypothetical protein
MGPVIPGVSRANPEVFAEGEVVSTGFSPPGLNRLLCVMGEGERREVLVNVAAGGGADGLDSTYTTTTGADGRHFQLGAFPVIANRTALLLNGVPLTILEASIDANAFSNRYDARLEISTGKIELQRSRIYNQGGSDYLPSSANQGNGTLTSLSLIDVGAPAESWTLRCTSVRRDGYGNPIDGYARFVVSGSVSGMPLDGYGQQITWQSDGYIRDNDILRFAINEGSTAFEVGDTFTIIIVSGVLAAGDNLLATYIATLDINDYEVFTEMDSVVAKHGLPSTENTVSLAAQIAFNNQAPQVACLEAAPGLPRRVLYNLVDTATGGATVNDLSFPLPLGVVPDVNSDIKFFSINPTTSVATQFLPNKVDFYNATITTNPWANFINSVAYIYSYTVVMEDGLIRSGETGTIAAVVGDTEYCWFTHSGTTFNTDDVAATYRMTIFGSLVGNDSPAGGFEVVDVEDGKLKLYWSGGSFTNESGNADLTWRVGDTDPTVQSATILLTDDLALTAGDGLQVLVIDTKDATFYDAGWTTALETLEAYELDMIYPAPTVTKSAIIQSTLSHCLAMSRIKNRKERILLTGAIQGLLPVNVTGQELAAVEDIGVLEGIQGDDPLEILAGNIEDLTNYSVSDAFGGTYRCVYMYPDKIVVNINGTNTFVDGMYMAPAIGGRLAATGNVAMPMTNKNLSGFSILNDRIYSTSVAEDITYAGITLVEPILGGGRIIWGKTTTQSGFAEEEEISIVFIRDRIAKVSRLALRGFIGLPEDTTFATTLLTRVNGLLNSFVNQNLITKYANVVVKRDDVEPRQWNIRFQVQPVYPVNWIYVKFTIGRY